LPKKNHDKHKQIMMARIKTYKGFGSWSNFYRSIK